MSSSNDSTPPCFDCAIRATERPSENVRRYRPARAIALGQKPAERPVFRKAHCVAHGWLERAKDIPEDLKIGVFAHERFRAWARYSKRRFGLRRRRSRTGLSSVPSIDMGGSQGPTFRQSRVQLEQERVCPEQRRQHQHAAIAILDVGWMDDGVQHQA
jgi:hypothetical protein